MERPTRDQTFMALAKVFALRGTCPRASVGAVIVYDGHVIAHGYNGAPAGLPHCRDMSKPYHVSDGIVRPCEDAPGQGCMNAVHAEENAIAYAARVGVRCDGASLYCTHEPCLRCARLIIQSGIYRVVYQVPYRNHDGLSLLTRAGITHVWDYIDMDITLGA